MDVLAIHRAPRSVGVRTVQCLLGHGFFGEFYDRHNIPENVACPCGEPLQTREHILRFCPLYRSVRHFLRKASAAIDLRIILGTMKGREALVAFLASTAAFKKSARILPPDPVEPEPGEDLLANPWPFAPEFRKAGVFWTDFDAPIPFVALPR